MIKLKSLALNIALLLSLLFISSTSWAASQTIVPLQFSQGMASANVVIQGKTIPLLLDTGASQTVIALSPSALQNLKVNFTGEQHCSRTVSGVVCMKGFIIPEI